MIERPRQKLTAEEQVERIMKERTPSPKEVIYEPTVKFFDTSGMTREEMGRVIAMGDRTAVSYDNLKSIVVGERGKEKIEVDGEFVDPTTNFYMAYALAARSSKEIAHTSILEQMNPGPSEIVADPPFVMEGISILSALRDVCSLRHAGLEVFSSRGGVFPNDYWRIPVELEKTAIGKELEVINGYIYQIYLDLTRDGLSYYLQKLERREDEKPYQYRWRVLNHALDDARQVTNGTFLCHLAFHPNSALALREGIVDLATIENPETQWIAKKLRELGKLGLPSLMRHTEPSEYRLGLSEIKERIREDLSLFTFYTGGSKRIDRISSITSDAERIFIAAFVADRGEISFPEVYEMLQMSSNQEVDEAVKVIFQGIGLHDKPPKQLEMLQIQGNFLLSVGAIYELIRHRLSTYIMPEFTPHNGYTTPQAYQDMGVEDVYKQGIQLNERQYVLIKKLGERALKIFGPAFVSRAHSQPLTMRVSGYDVFHLLKLRADRAAHPDLRDPMLEFENALRQQSPSIFRHLIKRQ